MSHEENYNDIGGYLGWYTEKDGALYLIQTTTSTRHFHEREKRSTMVILIAAAATAAGYGAYRGGTAAVKDVKRKNARNRSMKEKKDESDQSFSLRKEEEALKKKQAANLSANDRLERFKKSVPGGGDKKKGLSLFGKRK
jgi:hypothetical protein